MPKYPHIHVKLLGTDGNAFSLIGKVRRAIEKSEGREVAKAFTSEAMDKGSYDELLTFLMETVDVQ